MAREHHAATSETQSTQENSSQESMQLSLFLVNLRASIGNFYLC